MYLQALATCDLMQGGRALLVPQQGCHQHQNQRDLVLDGGKVHGRAAQNVLAEQQLRRPLCHEQFYNSKVSTHDGMVQRCSTLRILGARGRALQQICRSKRLAADDSNKEQAYPCRCRMRTAATNLFQKSLCLSFIPPLCCLVQRSEPLHPPSGLQAYN